MNLTDLDTRIQGTVSGTGKWKSGYQRAIEESNGTGSLALSFPHELLGGAYWPEGWVVAAVEIESRNRRKFKDLGRVRVDARLRRKNGRDSIGGSLFPSGKTISFITLLILGGYFLHDGTSDQSPDADVIVVGGAVCLALGILIVVLAGRAILADRRMARHLRGR